jgi:hypothetical protein
MKESKLCIVVGVLLVMSLISSVSLMGANSAFAQEATTVIKPQAIDYFVSEHRIKVSAEIKDEAGVKVARCYFRAAGQADYVFVPMESVKENLYEGILPKPSKETQRLEYILLAVNQKGQIVKTEVFKSEKNDEKEVPPWQQVVSEGDIKVSTELAKAPEKLSGFNDSVSLDVVESSGRFGTSAGIYSLLTASSGGMSTAAVAGIAAGVVAGGVAIGAAVGSGDDDDEDTNIKITPSDPQTILYGETRDFSVTGGKSPYTWTENVTTNSDSTKATFNSAEVGTGTATITVRDSQGNSASVTVEVKPNVNVTF